MAKKGRIIGIDLGTTNSVVAIVDMGGPRILQNKEHEQLTRSVVGYFKNDFLVGTPALQRWPSAPEDTIVSVKRLMGRSINDQEIERIKEWALYKIVEPSDGTGDSVNVVLGGKEYSPIDISAIILKKLKSDAEFILGEDVTHAVITVPAYFSDKQRHATRLAGMKAGLTVMKILEEPTAAAIAYGVESRENDAKVFLVYDLGGGTFDISVLMMSAGAFSPLNLEGDMWLGGDNFDQVIVDFVIDYVKKEFHVDPMQMAKKPRGRFLATLKMEARKAKETLGQARTAPIFIPGLLQDENGPIDIEIDFTREQFEQMIKPLVDKSVYLVKKAMEHKNVQFSIDEIDHVLMAGNSTAVPLVQETVEQLVGKEKILRKMHPKFCVAIGAAIAAAAYSRVHCDTCGYDNELDADICFNCKISLREPLINLREKESGQSTPTPMAESSGWKIIVDGIHDIGDIAPFTYGILTPDDKFTIFIEKGDHYETPKEKRKFEPFATRFPNQRIISIPVHGGDDLEYPRRNPKQGEAFAILPPNLPAETGVRLKLWLNRFGEFDIEARLENDGTPLSTWILRGGKDQKAKEKYEAVLETYLKKVDKLSPEDQKRAEDLHNGILDKLKVKQFQEAEKSMDELKIFLDEAKDQLDPLPPIEILILNYCQFIIQEYGWIIGQEAYDLNRMAADLKEAIDKNNRPLIDQKQAQLEQKLDSLMVTVDQFGKHQPSLLAVFIGINGVINSAVRPNDPALAWELDGELKSIQSAFKNRQYDASDKLNIFSVKLQQVINDLPQAQEGQSCPACGIVNKVGTHYCLNCNYDLWIIGTKRGAVGSSKDFKRS